MKIYINSKGEERYMLTQKEQKTLKEYSSFIRGIMIHELIHQACENKQIFYSKKFKENLELEQRLKIGL